MSQATQQTIEFIGGPLDGHVEVVAVHAERLPLSISCFISENVFRLLDGRERKPEFCITSMAVYQRRLNTRSCSYTFQGALAPDDVAFEPMVKPSSRAMKDL